MKRIIRASVATAAACTLLASAALAQQFVYPAKGQSPAQQKKDEAECTTWAQGQMATAPTQAAPPPQNTTATGVARGAGVRGAARGAVVGEIVGDDAGAGAAAGAAAARAQSRRQNAQQAQASQQQAASSQQANLAKARAACLEGRGYTVK
jgi:hypothetical protein